LTPEFRAVDLADREHRHGVQNVETLRDLITTCYFVAKWVPKILTDMGFAASAAGGVLGWMMLGAAIGGATVGILTHRFGLKGLTIGALLMSFALVMIFGRSPADLQTLTATICS
jgi:cyanate permease